MDGRGRHRWRTACACGLFVLAAPRAGRADPLDLVWQGPDACSTGDEVRREFERSTSVRPGRTPPHLSATAQVEARGGHWLLHLHTVRDGVEGDRDIAADSCASLTRAAALVLGLAFGEGAEPEPPAPSPPAAPPPPPPPPAAPPPRAARPSARIAWSMTLDGRVAWGPLPGAAPALATTLDARGSWWGASARVISWPGASGDPAPGLQTHFTGVGGALSLCVLARPSRSVMLAGCAGLQASAIRGTSSGAPVALSAVAPWYAAIPALRLRIRLFGTLHAEVGGELATSLTRPSFLVLGLAAPVHVVPELSPSASLGLSLDI